MLKDLAETGSVPSSIELNPEASHPSCHYVGIARSSSMAEIPELMVEDFVALKNYFCENQIELGSPHFRFIRNGNYPKGWLNTRHAFLSVKRLPVYRKHSFFWSFLLWMLMLSSARVHIVTLEMLVRPACIAGDRRFSKRIRRSLPLRSTLTGSIAFRNRKW